MWVRLSDASETQRELTSLSPRSSSTSSHFPFLTLPFLLTFPLPLPFPFVLLHHHWSSPYNSASCTLSSTSSAVTLPERNVTPSPPLHTALNSEQSLASLEQDSPVTNMSTTFSTLPDLVKSRILEFLLDRRELQQLVTDDKSSIFKYEFNTAILRVNKDIYDLGKRIFLRNNFVLLSVSLWHLFNYFVRYKLPMWTEKL